ncbi:MAG: hypothetical protein ABL884_08085 [Methyloglobulus sp.]
MKKSNLLKSTGSALFLVLAFQFMAVDALATEQIENQAIGLKVIPLPTKPPSVDRRCLACHTTGFANADKGNLKPGYQAAYKLNKSTLANLKTLLNTLPTTTVGLTNSGLAKTDIYEVICATGATSLTSQVKDLAPAKLATVSTQVTKGAAVSPLITDGVDGDAVYSAATKLAGGVGPYSVRVNKSAYTGTIATQKGAETYAGLLSCRTATNVATGLAWRIIQNQ